MVVQNFVCFYFVTALAFHIYGVNSLLPPTNEIEASEAPFMVYVSNWRNYCGGAILSERIVLTAKHCIFPGTLTITAGKSKKYTHDNVQTVTVEKDLPHENYLLDPNGIQAYYDVGLLLLKTPLTFNEYVQPIGLASNVDYGVPATIYGWGSTEAFYNAPSSHLRSKNVSLIADDVCIGMLGKAITKCTKQVYELCAEKSACNGDSGSPIVQKVDNTTKLIGVTSWLADDNISCDTAPAVFESVPYFSQWIKDGMRTLLKENTATDVNQIDNENVVV